MKMNDPVLRPIATKSLHASRLLDGRAVNGQLAGERNDLRSLSSPATDLPDIIPEQSAWKFASILLALV
jgi:hypothetical protein